MNIFGNVQRFAMDRVNQMGDMYNTHIKPHVDNITAPRPAAAASVPAPYGPGGSSTGSGLGQAQQQAAPRLEPRRQAVADTLSYAEGTWNADKNEPDYTMRYGDRPGEGSLDTSAPHPLDVRSSIYGSGNSSNASGAYQFLDNTWSEMNDGRNAPMTPANQDRAVTDLIESTGYDYDAPFEGQAHKLSGRWASIPNADGVSNYNQPTPHSAAELGDFYRQRVDERTRQYREESYSGR